MVITGNLLRALLGHGKSPPILPDTAVEPFSAHQWATPYWGQFWVWEEQDFLGSGAASKAPKVKLEQPIIVFQQRNRLSLNIILLIFCP